MIQNNIHNFAAKVLTAEKKVITEKVIIEALKGICEQRSVALSQYPSARHFAAGMEAVNRIRVSLHDANAQLNYKSAVKICLRTELDFHYLSPRTTIKIFRDYHARLNFLMAAAREILNYKQQ